MRFTWGQQAGDIHSPPYTHSTIMQSSSSLFGASHLASLLTHFKCLTWIHKIRQSWWISNGFKDIKVNLPKVYKRVHYGYVTNTISPLSRIADKEQNIISLFTSFFSFLNYIHHLHEAPNESMSILFCQLNLQCH